MRQKPEAYFLIFILLVSLALIIRSIAFPYLESKLLPLIVGGIVFVLTAVALIMELRAKEKPKRVREPWEGEELELRQYGWTGAWLGGYALAIYLLGFVIATPAFVLSYLKLHGTGWLKTIIITVVTTAFVYGVFELILRITLYRGLLFS